MTKFTLDRFEGEKAVLLQKGNETVERVLRREQLPTGVKEGDILEIEFQDNGEVKEARILINDTNHARQEAQSLLGKLIQKNK